MEALKDIAKAQRILIKSINAIVSCHVRPSGYVARAGLEGDKDGRLLLWDTQDRRIRGGSESITPMYAMGVGWCSADAYGGGMVSKQIRDLSITDLVLLYQAVLLWDNLDEAAPNKKAKK